MEEVFVVQGCNDGYHEHNDIIAICSTEERAEIEKAKHEARKCETSGCDYHYKAYIFPMQILT